MISPVDALLLLALGLTTVVGVLRGAVKEGLTLLLWLLALGFAVALGREVAHWLPVALGEGLLRDRFALLLVFALALALGTVVQKLLFLGALDVDLGFLGHLLGGAFGALRGGLFLLVMAGLLGPLLGPASWWAGSHLSAPLGDAFEVGVLVIADLLAWVGWY
ncbi:MAG: CvpA family protein [Pseudomonadales bacterium]|jgi:membrane protein required for colicin V production|nr:CvpA family protein [Pseudomonadales bacterium]MBL6808783.1 CvpA family protein [Pseudomonadales bacterium]